MNKNEKYIFRDVNKEGRRVGNYKPIANSLIDDRRLSSDDLKIMVTLLSNKDDFNQKTVALAIRCKLSEEVVAARLKYLEKLGFVRRVKLRNDKGQWGWKMYVYEIPRPPSDKPGMVEPDHGEPGKDGTIHITNSNINQEEITKNNLRNYKEDLGNKDELLTNSKETTPNSDCPGNADHGYINMYMDELPPEAYEIEDEDENENPDYFDEYWSTNEWRKDLPK
jgi:DNA-binding Lrp family transcriptional regulator